MAGPDYKLKFVIDADGTTAKQALAGLAADVNKLGGGFTSTFGGLIPLAGAGAAAIAGMATAAAGVGVALFNITKSAAEFGSTIYDASQKTGLGATALSALKVSAEQSGSSLEAVTKGVAKFAKNYEGTSSDLQAELGKVFKQINDAKPGFEQLTLAQKHFGKAGADLIPMIRSTKGDLGGMIAEMERLGVTIDDKAAYQADQFGDQLDTLNAQIAGVGRTIGTALMPEFTRMASSMSNWLASNRGEVDAWANSIADSFSAVIRMIKDTAIAVRGLGIEFSRLKKNDDGTYSGTPSPYTGLLGYWFDKSKADAEYERNNTYGPYAWEMSPSSGPGKYDPDKSPGGGGKKIRPPKETDGEFRKFFQELGFGIVRTFGKAINDGSPHPYGGAADVSIKGKTAADIFTLMVKALEKGYRVFDERVKAPGVKQTGPHLHFENAKTTLQKASRFTGFQGDQLAYLQELDRKRLGKATGMDGFESFQGKTAAESKKIADDELDYAEQVLQDWINAEKEASNERLEIRGEENSLAEEMLRDQLNKGLISETEYIDRIATLKINALEDEREELAAQIATRETNHKIAKLELKIATEKLKKENDIADALERQNAEYREMIGALKKANQRPYGMKTRTANDGGFFGDIFGGMDEATGKIRNFQDIIQGLGSVASDVFMQIGQGLGATLQSWVLLGDQAEVSMSKMVATILAGVAAQAATLAIFHLAMGLVALTPWGAAMYGPATNHFIAAAIWGGIAAGAAVGGRALAGNKFQSGSGKGSTSSSNRSSDSESLTPYSRASERAYHSGTQQDPVRRLATAVEHLDKKIGSMKPGDVLTAGARQRPGFFATQANNDIARNSALGSRIARNIGIR